MIGLSLCISNFLGSIIYGKFLSLRSSFSWTIITAIKSSLGLFVLVISIF